MKSVPYIDAAVDAADQDDFRERSKNECLSMRRPFRVEGNHGRPKQPELQPAVFLSAKSAYVSGQIVQIDKSTSAAATNPVAPLTGKLALVTGAARGIGLAIAQTLSRDGATVIGVDLPATKPWVICQNSPGTQPLV
nr:SDR family NAD(P)-dependent oxidoreductase [Marinobacter gelidimuriae]